MTRRLATVLIAAAVLLGTAAALPAAAGASPPVVGPLHTAGNQIIDGNGQPVTPRGVNSGWLTTNTQVWPDTPLGDDSIAAMRAWGATAVRVALGEQYWDADECQHVAGYLTTVDQVVQSITSRGMLAVLTLETNTGIPCLPAGAQRMADNPGSLQFWQSVASRYKNNPLVAFDLYNEPHNITWAQWLNGGILVDGAVAWKAAGMQQMYDAVRSTGAQNLVIVSGNNWADSPPPAQDTVQGGNIVYAVHSYATSCGRALVATLLCDGQTPPTPTAVGAALPQWDQFLTTHPVLVSEFGSGNPASGTYNQEVIAWAQSHGVGWLAYDWGIGRAAPAQYGLLSTQAPSYQPDGAGTPVQQALLGQP